MCVPFLENAAIYSYAIISHPVSCEGDVTGVVEADAVFVVVGYCVVGYCVVAGGPKRDAVVAVVGHCIVGDIVVVAGGIHVDAVVVSVI